MRAFDMSRYQRVIAVDEGRIRGTFHVSGSDQAKTTWVKAHDVVIWDEGHRAGRVFYSNDLAGSVTGGNAELSKHMVNPRLLPDVEDVWEEMLAVLAAVVEEFWAKAPTDEVSS